MVVKYRINPVGWLAVALLIAMPGVGSAAPAAVLGNVTGTGYVNPGQRKLASGMALNASDQIILRSGKVSLKMADGTTVRLAGPAEFMIETARDAAGRSIFQAAAGKVFVNTRQRPGGEVHVITPSATLAVRGSGGGVDASSLSSLCWCDEGLVYVDAAGERVLLRPGYETLVMRGQAPGDPIPMGEETRETNEGLNLDASLNGAPDLTGSLSYRERGEGGGRGGPVSDDTVAVEHIAAAEEVLRSLYAAYEGEDLPGTIALLAADFNANDTSGFTRNLSNVEESFRQDFLNLDNIRFFRQPGMSRRFYRESDRVSLRERWIMNAVLPSGARLQQGGETVFTVGADPGGGGLRVARWEGDVPFGRYHPTGDTMRVAAPTVITAPSGSTPDVLLTRGEVAAGGATIADADAQVRSGGVVIESTGVSITDAGTVALTDASFTINGVEVTADTVTVDSDTSFQTTDVEFSAGGTQVEADALEVSGGTVEVTGATVTDPQGNTVTLVTGTISTTESGTVISGTTDTNQTVTAVGGQIIYEPAPGTPLPAGRGERMGDGQGFQFAAGVVLNNASDLYLSAGRLDPDGGVLDLGVVSFAGVLQAPESGYLATISVSETLVNHVLVVQLASGGYAKLLVRAGTTPTLLCFDWVFNPDGTALYRGRRQPTRAVVNYDGKVYNRTASGHQTFLREGMESLVSVQVESSRNLGNGAMVEAYLAPRFSTDRQVDQRNANVDRFGFRYFLPNEFEASMGDLSGQFTPYTLNQSLLGLVGWRNFSIGPAGTARLMATTGPRWLPGSGFRFDGWVTGVRLATEELRDLGPNIEDMVVGINVVRSHRGKRASNTYNVSTVVSLDTTLRLKNGLGLMAEVAESHGKSGARAVKGDARLVRAAYRIGALRLILDREWVENGFVTVSGSAAADQERTNLWVRYRPSDWLSANFNVLHTRDNLDGTKPYKTLMTVPRYGLSVSPFYPMLRAGFLRSLTVDVLLRHTLRHSDDSTRSVDKKLRSLSLALIQRVGDFTLTLGRSEERDLDFTPTGVSRRGHATDVNLRWRPRRGIFAMPLSPLVGVRTGRDDYTGGPRGSISSRFESRRMGLDIGDPNSLSVELGYELLDNNRTDLGGYDRQVLNVDLTRALDREGSRTAGVTYRLSHNRQENGARKYTEGEVAASISQKF